MAVPTAAPEPLEIELGDGPVRISTRFRPGGDDLLLCLHGLGCAKESFDSAFNDEAFAGLSIATFDFPGHGGSDRLPDVAYSVQTYADLTLGLIRRLSPKRVFLVCHSMGCAVGLVASQELRDLLAGFVSVEGNLLPQDCGLASRAAAALPEPEFVEQEYPRFHAALTSSPRTDLRTWAGWYGQADPVALHRIARSLVEWSDSGKLISLFTSLPNAGYVHGDQSGDLSYLLPSLRGVRVHSIPGSGHFPMQDNPHAFWPAVAATVHGGH